MRNLPEIHGERRGFRFAWMVALLAAVALVQGCADDALLPSDGALPDALLRAARASESSLDYRGAADAYRKLASVAPNNVEMTLGVARNLRYAGETLEARDVVAEALSRHPKESALLLESGKIQIALGRHLQAVDDLTLARSIDAGNWRTHMALGVARDNLGQFKEARESYQVALGLSQDNPSILNNMALSMAQDGEIADAVSMLELASRHPNATVQIRQNLAVLKAVNGETEEAERLENQNLPPDMARHNMEYLRILGAKARKHRAAK